MSDGEGAKGEESTTRRVDIPDFLQPLFRQGAGTATSALSNAQQLAGGDTVADFNPDQIAGFDAARDVATGGGDFIPRLQAMLGETAGGRSLESFLDPTAFSALTGAAGDQGFGSSLSPEVLAALNSTVGGDFLHGGSGFDAAVQASVNSALPHIASAFGGTTGGLSGSSARQAVGDTAVDAHARQFGEERNRQLTAANLLAGVGDSESQRRLQAGGLLGNLGSQERDRQEAAGRALPGSGLLGSDILRNIGGEQQDQAQRELRSPLDNQLQLLAAALGIPLGALLGDTTDSEYSRFGLGFGGE